MLSNMSSSGMALLRASSRLLAGAGRAFGSAAMPDVKSGSSGEALPVGGDEEGDPVLVRLPSRPWGPSAELPADLVRSVVGDAAGKSSRPLAVLRDAFRPSDAKPRSLSHLVAQLPSGGLAVASEVADPSHRILVDEYWPSEDGSGKYELHSIANDLLSYLAMQSLPVCLVPSTAGLGGGKTKKRGFNSVVGLEKGIRQSTNEVLMVAPTAFGFNEQAAQDNSFMHAADKAHAHSSLTKSVVAEFAGLYHQLTEVAGVQVHLFEHALHHGTPDACFPNNWVSTHPEGEADGGVASHTMVLYPMKCPNRAAERRPDIIGVLKARGYDNVVDMTGSEKAGGKAGGGGAYFEGTGVLVLDRINGVAYVNISERADKGLAEQWVAALGYKELVAFRSTDRHGAPVYHTNVMMAIGTDVAVVCAESVADAKERQHMLAALRRHHEVVEISHAQMERMAGNCLELENGKGLPVLAMSSQAYAAFSDDQKKVLRRHLADIVHAPIDTLEKVGGGSVRCTLAEIF